MKNIIYYIAEDEDEEDIIKKDKIEYVYLKELQDEVDTKDAFFTEEEARDFLREKLIAKANKLKERASRL